MEGSKELMLRSIFMVLPTVLPCTEGVCWECTHKWVLLVLGISKATRVSMYIANKFHSRNIDKLA
jgi:hypothetical protein